MICLNRGWQIPIGFGYTCPRCSGIWLKLDHEQRYRMFLNMPRDIEFSMTVAVFGEALMDFIIGDDGAYRPLPLTPL